MEFNDEIWKDVVGYESIYQVSSLGRVKSFITRDNSGLRNPSSSKAGYYMCSLSKNKKKVSKYVHRLIAEAFIGDISELEVNHIDGNKKNNKLSNLEIVTTQQNTNHAIAMGLTNNVGANHGMAKLTDKIVLSIRIRYKHGEGMTSIARSLNHSVQNINNIVKNRTWKHLLKKR